ncbi:MAG: hypothetical protein M1814_003228 [Vezdaea aestivalis]|nr:MAG: hypothetical protein M1814_003228 [Vezdaea aestivalis]
MAASSVKTLSLTPVQQKLFASVSQTLGERSVNDYKKTLEELLKQPEDRLLYQESQFNEGQTRLYQAVNAGPPKPAVVVDALSGIDFSRAATLEPLINIMFNLSGPVLFPIGYSASTPATYYRIILDYDALTRLPQSFYDDDGKAPTPAPETTISSSAANRKDCPLFEFGNHPLAGQLPKYVFVLGGVQYSDKREGNFKNSGFVAVIDALSSNVWVISGPSDTAPEALASKTFPGRKIATGLEPVNAFNLGVSATELAKGPSLPLSSKALIFDKVPYSTPLSVASWEAFKAEKAKVSPGQAAAASKSSELASSAPKPSGSGTVKAGSSSASAA